jgi:hypothetical protein
MMPMRRQKLVKMLSVTEVSALYTHGPY